MGAAGQMAGETAVRKIDFAKLLHCHPSYVTKLIRLDRIVLASDGKSVLVEASKAKMAASADISKTGVTEYHAAARLERGLGEDGPLPGELPLGPASDPFSASGEGFESKTPTARNENLDRFNAARAESEEHRAANLRIELQKREGQLTDRPSVLRAAGEIAALLANSLGTLRPRLAPMLAAESDPLRVDALLRDEFRNLQNQLADELERRFPVDAPAVNNA